MDGWINVGKRERDGGSWMKEDFYSVRMGNLTERPARTMACNTRRHELRRTKGKKFFNKKQK